MTEARRAREQAGFDPNAISRGAYVSVACDPDLPTARRLVLGSTSIFIRFLAEAMGHAVPATDADRPIVAGVENRYQEAAHGLVRNDQADAVPDEFLQRFALVGAPADLTDVPSGVLQWLEVGQEVFPAVGEYGGDLEVLA